MINWTLENRAIKILKKYPKNPRKLSVDQYDHLHKSLHKFGLIDKPIINRDNTIIGGHQRISILKKDGFTEIQCWVPERQLAETELEELNIRLNRSGSWDWEMLANLYTVPDLLDFGFSFDEMQIATEDEKEESEEAEEKQSKHECPKCGHEF